jgi:hypothetical protein
MWDGLLQHLLETEHGLGTPGSVLGPAKRPPGSLQFSGSFYRVVGGQLSGFRLCGSCQRWPGLPALARAAIVGTDCQRWQPHAFSTHEGSIEQIKVAQILMNPPMDRTYQWPN